MPLQETLAGFDALVRAGKIRYWGVSNFDLGNIEELVSLPMGSNVAMNQVLYNLLRRGMEWDFLPWCRKRNIPIMAYSPVEQGRLLDHPTLKTMASRHGATPAQIALAWLARPAIMAIPRASRPEHIRENRQALEIHLADEDVTELDRAFPPPNGPSALAMR